MIADRGWRQLIRVTNAPLALLKYGIRWKYRGERYIPAPMPLRDAYDVVIIGGGGGGGGLACAYYEFVFTYKGSYLFNMLNSAWRKARDRAKLPGFRVHDLRHTFGHRLRAAGVGFEDRQDLLGRKSERITTISRHRILLDGTDNLNAYEPQSSDEYIRINV